jgi:hypothetical protein
VQEADAERERSSVRKGWTQGALDSSAVSNAHSHPVVHRARSLLREKNKSSKQEALMPCQAQSEGLISTAKKINKRGTTHILPSVERGNWQGSERKKVTEGWVIMSCQAERESRESSGQRSEAGEQGLLTNCRAQRDLSAQRKKANK